MAAKSRFATVAGFAVGLPLARELWRVRGEIGATRRALRKTAASKGRAEDGQSIGAQAAGGHAVNGRFYNSEPTVELAASPLVVAKAMLSRTDDVLPPGQVPLEPSDLSTPQGALAVTWLGHATVLFEVDGHVVLADPVFDSRVSPSGWLGPSRLHPAPIELADLPELDVVVISHDHYDHLERSTIVWLAAHRRCEFVVPIGLGAHLRGWGVAAERITELRWEQSTRVGELELVCTEARHFSGRGLRRNDTLWCGWAIIGPTVRAYFGGDSGYSACYEGIGREWGPFDVTVLPIGAYSEYWPDVHMSPEEALRAHSDLNPGKTDSPLLPIHWATFVLARHSWAEPIDRLVAAADADGGVALLVPRLGERAAVGRNPGLEFWWRGLAE